MGVGKTGTGAKSVMKEPKIQGAGMRKSDSSTNIKNVNISQEASEKLAERDLELQKNKIKENQNEQKTQKQEAQKQEAQKDDKKKTENKEKVPLKVLDVYWTDKAFGEESKIRLLPVNIEKSLIIETDVPDAPHDKKVEIQFLIPGSVLDKELSNITIDSDSYKDTVTVSGKERYRFEIKNITHDLIGL